MTLLATYLLECISVWMYLAKLCERLPCLWLSVSTTVSKWVFMVAWYRISKRQDYVPGLCSHKSFSFTNVASKNGAIKHNNNGWLSSPATLGCDGDVWWIWLNWILVIFVPWPFCEKLWVLGLGLYVCQMKNYGSRFDHQRYMYCGRFLLQSQH